MQSLPCGHQETFEKFRSKASKNLIVLGIEVKWFNYSEWEYVSVEPHGNCAHQEAVQV